MNKCEHEFMFTILLGTECWHIVPHPTSHENEVIITCLEEIIKELKHEKNSNNS